MSHLRYLAWLADGTRTSSDPGTKFMRTVKKELKEAAERFTRYMWPNAVLVVKNRNGLDGYDAHNNGFMNDPINANLLQWWCTWSDHYGYGIFHSAHRDQTTGEYRLVRLENIPMHSNTNFCEFRFQGVPFGHAAFAHTFWVATYGTGHVGWFGLTRGCNSSSLPLTEVSLLRGAAICSWVSFHYFIIMKYLIKIFGAYLGGFKTPGDAGSGRLVFQ